MKPPHVPDEPVPVLGDDDLRRLLAACEGKGFEERRDMAIVRLFLDSGMRLAELANLRVEDLDLDQDVAIVVGKGRRPRACPFGSKTARPSTATCGCGAAITLLLNRGSTRRRWRRPPGR